MKRLLLAIAAVAAAILPSTSNAAGYAGVFVVKGVVIEGNIFIIADGIGNPDGCSANDSIAMPSDANREAIISMAYTALSTGMRMSVWVNGCGQNVNRTVPMGYHFMLIR